MSLHLQSTQYIIVLLSLSQVEKWKCFIFILVILNIFKCLLAISIFMWVACSCTLPIFLLVMLALFNCKSSYIKNTGHMHMWSSNKRAPSEKQRESPQRSSTLLVPWSWTVSLQNFVEIWRECTKILLTSMYCELAVQCCRWCFCLFGAALIPHGRPLFTRS